jgi:hypothetical protein
MVGMLWPLRLLKLAAVKRKPHLLFVWCVFLHFQQLKQANFLEMGGVRAH